MLVFPSHFTMAILTTAILAIAGCGGSAGDAPPTGTVAGGASMSQEEEALARKVFDLVNTARAAENLPPLSWHFTATRAAYAHSLDMHRRGFFGHTNPDGLDPGQRLALDGLSSIGWGENIGRRARSAEEVVEAWLASPTHRETLLDPRWTGVGSGVSGTGDLAIWTQDFLFELPR